MRVKLLFVIFCASFELQSVNSAKILGLIPSSSKSHTILGQALFKKLAEYGHEVTMVTPYMLQKPETKLHTIHMKDVKKEVFGVDINNYLLEWNKNIFARVKQVYDFGYNLSKVCIEDAEIQKLINSDEKYDLVISTIFMNEVFFSFADHFKAPLLAFSTFGTTEWTNNLVGNPSPFAITPQLFLPYTEHMTFNERLINTLISIANELWYQYVHLPKQEALRQKHLPHTKPLWEILNNVSMVLLNSHPILLGPRALVPNMKEIGGFHIDAPKLLRSDLKKDLDDAKDGVVYFSMGTNIVSKDLPESYRKALLKAFSKLKQTVFWKWEDDNLPDQPKNVKISKWYPQSDLLAHPNVKLFITHGGLLSTTEAISRGVPMIGIPFFIDQSLNMAKAQNLGYGIMIDYYNVTFESIDWALNEVLNNPKYLENVKLRSKILNDRLVPPIDEAVYWVEYVLRHKGATHFQSARKDLTIFQYLLLDILAFILIVLASVILALKFLINKLFSIFRKTSKVSKKKNQ